MRCPRHDMPMHRGRDAVGRPWFECPVLGCEMACSEHGTPADRRTRTARASLHVIFDRLWRRDEDESPFEGRRPSDRRSEAYLWLRLATGRAHIGEMSLDEVRVALAAIRRLKA